MKMGNNSLLTIQNELSSYSKARLIAVSKTRSTSQILNLFNHGQLEFGENRVDELVTKSKQINEKILWHFIGRIQTNKLQKLLQVENLVAIHSIDRLSLVETLIKKEELLTSPLKLFLQFNTSEEEEKGGFSNEEELIEAISLINNSNKYLFHGLMTMGKIRTDDAQTDARHCFRRLAEIKKTLITKGISSDLELSMGMSGDYKIALEEGANVIRVGSALFE